MEGLRGCMVKLERVVTGRSEGNCIYSSECGVDSLHMSLIGTKKYGRAHGGRCSRAVNSASMINPKRERDRGTKTQQLSWIQPQEKKIPVHGLKNCEV
jgi:hypothetical protein